MGRLFEIVEAVGEAATTGDWDALADHYAEDVVAWSPTYDLVGRAAMVEVLQAQNGGVDVRQELSLVAETDDTVVFQWSWSIPHPSGVGRVSLEGLSYFTFEGDRIARLRQYWDNLGIMGQLEAATGAE
jgi:ketosteroid isomerase-like protein